MRKVSNGLVMKTLRYILTAATAFLVACGSSDSADATPQTGTSAYDEGRRAAERMLDECADSVAIQNFLLEFLADNYQIELNEGKQAAADNRYGFETMVTERNPELAAKLFE